MCYLYFLACDAFTDRIKIGITNNLQKRLVTHQTSNGSRVYYVLTIKHNTRQEAENMAKAIEHCCDTPINAGTEWVYLNYLLEQFIIHSKQLKGYILSKETVVDNVVEFLIDWNLNQLNKPNPKYIYISPTILQNIVIAAYCIKWPLSTIIKNMPTEKITQHHKLLGLNSAVNSKFGTAIVGNLLPSLIDI